MFTQAPQNPALAAGLIVLATAFIAGAMMMAKTLGGDLLGPALHPMQVSHGRFVFAFALIGTLAVVIRPAIGKVHWGLHIGRTSFGWMGVTLLFAAVAYIPIADATAISFLNPVFAMMLAIPLLGERVGPVRWSAAAVAMLGAVILLRPTPASFQPAALLALGAAMVMGMELIFIKRLTRREGIFQILIFNNMVGLVISSLAVLAVWQAPTGAQWAALAATGILMACAQTCFVAGMARADASFVAPFSYATLIFAALYDFVLFQTVPDRVSVLGASVILTGAVLLALREARINKRLP